MRRKSFLGGGSKGVADGEVDGAASNRSTASVRISNGAAAAEAAASMILEAAAAASLPSPKGEGLSLWRKRAMLAAASWATRGSEADAATAASGVLVADDAFWCDATPKGGEDEGVEEEFEEEESSPFRCWGSTTTACDGGGGGCGGGGGGDVDAGSDGPSSDATGGGEVEEEEGEEGEN